VHFPLRQRMGDGSSAYRHQKASPQASRDCGKPQVLASLALNSIDLLGPSDVSDQYLEKSSFSARAQSNPNVGPPLRHDQPRQLG
jgi:hypothetical protein